MAGLKMMGLKAGASLALGISAFALLSACDNGPSAVSKQAAGTQMATANAPERSYNSDRGGGSYDNAPKVDHRKDEVAKADDGKPMWAPSKRFSAEEGAQRQFERDGEAFGTKSLDQFVKKAHAFVGHPPKGTLTLTRKNGDVLYYDPKANVFAVSNKDGAPRTMFKPDDGMAYWEKQKDREARSQSARSGRKSKYADDQAD
jgi:pyocin large subunit-like protein